LVLAVLRVRHGTVLDGRSNAATESELTNRIAHGPHQFIPQLAREVAAGLAWPWRRVAFERIELCKKLLSERRIRNDRKRSVNVAMAIPVILSPFGKSRAVLRTTWRHATRALGIQRRNDDLTDWWPSQPHVVVVDDPSTVATCCAEPNDVRNVRNVPSTAEQADCNLEG
jgi:hypothetical protein